MGVRKSGCLGKVFALLVLIVLVAVLVPKGEKPAGEAKQEARKPPATRSESPEKIPLPSKAVPAVHPKEGTRDKPPEEALSQQQKEYLVYAALYSAAVRAQKTTASPQLDLGESGAAVGRMGGRYRITQILGSDEALCELVQGDYDIPVSTVWIEGISTTGHADGDYVGFPDSVLFVYAGTKAYTTVLGARRTVHSVRALDRSILNWAMSRVAKEESRIAAEVAAKRDEVSREQRERQEAAMQVVQKKVDGLALQLRQLEQENRRIDAYSQAKAKVEMYEGNENNPKIAELLKVEKAKMEAAGKVTDEDFEAYRLKKAALQKQVHDARMELARLREG